MSGETVVKARTTLDPKNDIVFWMLFGAEQNRGLLLSLLNAVLRPAEPIVSLTVLHAEPERSSVEDKGIALDIRAQLQNGDQVDVEMQSQQRPAQYERALYYWSRMYAGQLLRGAPYDELRKCVVVWISKFEDDESEGFHSIFQARTSPRGRLLSDRFELHLIELPSLQAALSQNHEPKLISWAKFLSATTDADLEALAMSDPVFRQAKDALDHLSADPVARIRAEMREMALISDELDRAKARRDGKAEGRAEGKAEGRAEGKAEGRAEGKAEGRAEGKAEGRAEIVRAQLTAKFGQLPTLVREQLESATEPQLLDWSKRLLFAGTLDEVFA